MEIEYNDRVQVTPLKPVAPTPKPKQEEDDDFDIDAI